MNLNSDPKYTTEQISISTLFRSMGHPARVAIIEEIATQKKCIDTPITIAPILPGTALIHLRGLQRAGLIKGTFNTKEGYSYCINWEKMDELKKMFDDLYKEVKQNKKEITEQNGKCIK